ncbi:MAG TPA: alpha/beta family hydrolase [Thermomicrobiales bacterium]|nr:alpha/beta family hydrolase [Thermomicrobiales bacterium]
MTQHPNKDQTPRSLERVVTIAIDPTALHGDLTIPPTATGVVLFAHGSGSSRFSSRNRSVAGVLQQGGFATLLLDLLTEQEEAIDQRTRQLRFDIPLLAARLTAAVDWLRADPSTHALPIGLFGASTGAGAALITAADRPDTVRAIVSRGGRPDLAGSALPRLQAPTLLIVGSRDEQVIELNQQARTQMRAHTELSIVPGATHLFEEPGTLEIVAKRALEWFASYLADDTVRSSSRSTS